MPSSVRDMWLYQRPVAETTKNNKKIVLPAFSANCGFAKKSLYIPNLDSNGGIITTGGGTITNLRTAFTVEAWVKLIPGFLDRYDGSVIVAKNNNGNTYCWNLSISEHQNGFVPPGILSGIIQTSAGTYRVFAPETMPTDNKWHHVAFSFISALPLLGEGGEPILGEGGEPILSETGEACLYIDGILQTTLATTGDIIDGSTGEFTIGSILSPLTFALGNLSDIRLWNYVRTPEQIMANKGTLRGVLDSGLVAYWKLREGHGTVLTDTITGLVANITAPSIVWSDESPEIMLGFGSSFIAYKYDVVVSSPCSLRFPVKLPRNSNHSLCVSWTDEDTGEFFRRKIYGGVGEDIDTFPSGDPLPYRGEKLASTFTFEFWNVDGNATVDLSSDLTIYTSHTANPVTGIDHSNTADDVPIGTGKLSASFPWVFPITFNEQQTYT